MAKHSARDASIYLDDNTGACQSLSGDFNTATLNWTSEQVDVTGFGSKSRERIHEVIYDWTFSFAGFFNEAANQVDEVLAGSAAGIGIGGSTILWYGPSGSSTGEVKYAGCGILVDYNIESTFDGAVTVTGTVIARTGSLTHDVWA